MSLHIESDADNIDILAAQHEAWGNKLKNVVLTWFEGEREYRLEFHF